MWTESKAPPALLSTAAATHAAAAALLSANPTAFVPQNPCLFACSSPAQSHHAPPHSVAVAAGHSKPAQQPGGGVQWWQKAGTGLWGTLRHLLLPAGHRWGWRVCFWPPPPPPPPPCSRCTLFQLSELQARPTTSPVAVRPRCGVTSSISFLPASQAPAPSRRCACRCQRWAGREPCAAWPHRHTCSCRLAPQPASPHSTPPWPAALRRRGPALLPAAVGAGRRLCLLLARPALRGCRCGRLL